MAEKLPGTRDEQLELAERIARGLAEITGDQTPLQVVKAYKDGTPLPRPVPLALLRAQLDRIGSEPEEE